MTDYVLKVLGLDVCSDTIVGNDMLRGVSGGQKKRVTTGDLLKLVAILFDIRFLWYPIVKLINPTGISPL